MQNTPEGVRLAGRQQSDFVELDVRKSPGGGFHCAHGWDSRSELKHCLRELGEAMELIAHLKGRYEDADLLQLVEEMARHIPLDRVIFAAHRTDTLRQLGALMPKVRLARFGLFPAIVALWRKQLWKCCMINHAVLMKWHVQALQWRGYTVFASCVWELRSRRSVQQLGVDGAFINLY